MVILSWLLTEVTVLTWGRAGLWFHNRIAVPHDW